MRKPRLESLDPQATVIKPAGKSIGFFGAFAPVRTKSAQVQRLFPISQSSGDDRRFMTL
jgi:hypothetical protein